MKKSLLSMVLFCCCVMLSPAYAGQGDVNIRTAPVSDLIGIGNVEVDYAITHNFTVGPTLYRFNAEFANTNYENSLYGGRVSYYFKEALAGGWLASVTAAYGQFKVTREVGGQEFSTNTNMHVYTALFSYQAMWDHFNITTGIGASYFSLPETVVGYSGVDVLTINTSFMSGVVPNAEFMLGWKF